ncbi:MAG: cbb3-type cytochrome c oxidase subunit I, partial [Hyphomicrobium sp.]
MAATSEEGIAFGGALAAISALGVAAIGLVFAFFGTDEAIRFHGAVTALVGALGVIYILNNPRQGGTVERGSYFDGPIKVATIAAVFWGIAGFLVGDILAWQLAFPALNFDLPWTNFGRLRPLHTSAVIFAFGGNVLLATSLYVVQRTSRARMFGHWLPWFVVWGYQLVIVLAGTGYLLGVTGGKEYAEPEWYVDLLLTLVWVGYFVVFVGTLARRNEPHIYVANWFYLAFIVTVAMLHIVNNLAVPVSFLGSKSYSLFAGVQDAMTQWWYGHNAVGFFLTAGFLGIMYYFIPKRVERPVYSYRLSIVHFWSLIFLYIWAGPHHLHYTALPDWAQTLGMTFSI